MSDDDKKRDHVHVGPVQPDGSVPVFRKTEAGLEVGKVQLLEEGKPIMGELVSLTACEDGDGHWMESLDVGKAGSSGGPAMVNSKKYRDGWDGLFGKKSLFGAEIEPGEA